MLCLTIITITITINNNMLYNYLIILVKKYAKNMTNQNKAYFISTRLVL